MSQNKTDDARKILTPAFRALDELRAAIDAAEQAGDDQIAAALIWAVCDVADTIDLISDLLKKNDQAQLETADLDDVADCIELVVR